MDYNNKLFEWITNSFDNKDQDPDFEYWEKIRKPTMDVLEKVKKAKRKVKEKVMERMGVDKICWTTLGFQDPKEFDNPEDAEGEAVSRLLIGGDGTQVVIVKITKVDEDGKPLKYPTPEIHREYNGGVQWVRDSLNPPKEFLT